MSSITQVLKGSGTKAWNENSNTPHNGLRPIIKMLLLMMTMTMIMVRTMMMLRRWWWW